MNLDRYQWFSRGKNEDLGNPCMLLLYLEKWFDYLDCENGSEPQPKLLNFILTTSLKSFNQSLNLIWATVSLVFQLHNLIFFAFNKICWNQHFWKEVSGSFIGVSDTHESFHMLMQTQLKRKGSQPNWERWLNGHGRLSVLDGCRILSEAVRPPGNLS